MYAQSCMNPHTCLNTYKTGTHVRPASPHTSAFLPPVPGARAVQHKSRGGGSLKRWARGKNSPLYMLATHMLTCSMRAQWSHEILLPFICTHKLGFPDVTNLPLPGECHYPVKARCYTCAQLLSLDLEHVKLEPTNHKRSTLKHEASLYILLLVVARFQILLKKRVCERRRLPRCSSKKCKNVLAQETASCSIP
jgi:hypothetical protein